MIDDIKNHEFGNSLELILNVKPYGIFSVYNIFYCSSNNKKNRIIRVKQYLTIYDKHFINKSIKNTTCVVFVGSNPSVSLSVDLCKIRRSLFNGNKILVFHITKTLSTHLNLRRNLLSQNPTTLQWNLIGRPQDASLSNTCFSLIYVYFNLYGQAEIAICFYSYKHHALFQY